MTSSESKEAEDESEAANPTWNEKLLEMVLPHDKMLRSRGEHSSGIELQKSSKIFEEDQVILVD